MKWVTYDSGDGARTGILDGETVRGLAAGTTLEGLLAAGDLTEAGEGAARAPAEEHIVGYTFYNDWTARDHQLGDLARGIGLGKSKDSATTLGPALVTVDELKQYRRGGRLAFALSATVNGEELTHGTLDQMDWTFGELLAYVSRGTDLTPGSVIGSGTVPGGCLLEHVDTASPAGLQALAAAGRRGEPARRRARRNQAGRRGGDRRVSAAAAARSVSAEGRMPSVRTDVLDFPERSRVSRGRARGSAAGR